MRRGADDRDERSDRASERRDGVVRAEDPGRIRGRVREHRLLERREWPGLDDVGRDRARQSGKHECRRPARQREGCPGGCHPDQEQAIAATPPNAVAIPGEQDRDDGDASEQGGQDRADLRRAEMALRKRLADQD